MKKMISILVVLMMAINMFTVFADEEIASQNATPVEALETTEAPAEEAAEAPAEEIVAEEAAEAPAEEIAAEEAAEAPAEETVVEEAAEAPAEETAVEEAAEVPAEETAVEEAIEVSAEEIAVEETVEAVQPAATGIEVVAEVSEISVDEATEAPVETEAATVSEPQVEVPVADEIKDETATSAEAEIAEYVTEEETAEVKETEADDEVEVSVRVSADGMSDITYTVDQNTEIEVIEIGSDWVKIKIGEEIGFIYKDDAALLGIELPKEESKTAPKLTIFSSRKAVMAYGEKVYLTSKLEGLDGYTITYQWQCDAGNGFTDIPGANADTYAFESNVETLSYSWRLIVFFE